jgi:hypothetical protein
VFLDQLGVYSPGLLEGLFIVTLSLIYLLWLRGRISLEAVVLAGAFLAVVTRTDSSHFDIAIIVLLLGMSQWSLRRQILLWCTSSTAVLLFAAGGPLILEMVRSVLAWWPERDSPGPLLAWYVTLILVSVMFWRDH